MICTDRQKQPVWAKFFASVLPSCQEGLGSMETHQIGIDARKSSSHNAWSVQTWRIPAGYILADSQWGLAESTSMHLYDSRPSSCGSSGTDHELCSRCHAFCFTGETAMPSLGKCNLLGDTPPYRSIL